MSRNLLFFISHKRSRVWTRYFTVLCIIISYTCVIFWVNLNDFFVVICTGFHESCGFHENHYNALFLSQIIRCFGNFKRHKKTGPRCHITLLELQFKGGSNHPHVYTKITGCMYVGIKVIIYHSNLARKI